MSRWYYRAQRGRTHTDRCQADGHCIGIAYSCDDGEVCTSVSCDSFGGCINTFNTEPCNDGDDCTQNDVCSEGTCTGTLIDGDPNGQPIAAEMAGSSGATCWANA